MLRWLRWYLAKRKLAAAGWWQRSPHHVHMSIELNKRRLEDFPPTVDRYEKLASLWEDMSAANKLSYASFLASIEAHFAVPIKAVLDLACGTGALTRHLGEKVDVIVGLDSSEEMLREPCSRNTGSSQRYVRGDFRDFCLETTFDACICGNDSLNYVETPEQIDDVFAASNGHLRPGGFFVFDVLDHLPICQALAPTSRRWCRYAVNCSSYITFTMRRCGFANPGSSFERVPSKATAEFRSTPRTFAGRLETQVLKWWTISRRWAFFPMAGNSMC